MRVAVFGSKEWSNYMDLVRSITLFIQDSHEIGHEGITFVHSGCPGAETMITEYVGKTEKFLRQKNFKLKEEIKRGSQRMSNYIKVIESEIEYALIFSTRDNATRTIVKILKEYNIPHGIIESA